MSAGPSRGDLPEDNLRAMRLVINLDLGLRRTILARNYAALSGSGRPGCPIWIGRGPPSRSFTTPTTR